jgi:hypothetical protein
LPAVKQAGSKLIFLKSWDTFGTPWEVILEGSPQKWCHGLLMSAEEKFELNDLVGSRSPHWFASKEGQQSEGRSQLTMITA